jgi:VIT1/CCC1 family predicted Fe2+/Mn2+ transporter
MSTAQITQHGRQAQHQKATFVGIYYLLTAAAGAFVLFFHGRQAFTADLVAAVLYVAATAFFYALSRSEKPKGALTHKE